MKLPAQGTVLQRFVAEVRNMMDAQERFFKAERGIALKQSALFESKEYERRVRALLREIDAEIASGQERLLL